MPSTEQLVVADAKLAHDKGSSDFSNVYKDIERLQQEDRSNPQRWQADLRQMNRQLHALGVLPGIDLTGTDGQNHLTKVASLTWLQKTEHVASEVGKGAWDEVTHHYGRVIGSAALGVGIGIGASLLAPEVAVGVGIAGLGLGAYQLATHIPKWYHDAKVVANPGAFSTAETRRAEQGLHSFGGGAVDVTAGLAGGIAGSKFANSELFASIKSAITKPTAEIAGAAPEVAGVKPQVEVTEPKPIVEAPARTPEIPKLELSSDDFSIKASVPGVDRAYFRAEVPEPGVVEVTDIFRGDLPKGSGGRFLADALEGHGALPTKELVLKNIANQPTIDAYHAGADPATTVLGKTAAKALELLGLRPTSYEWAIVRGKLMMLIKTK